MRAKKTLVINRRFDIEDVYIGRGSPFGNPFIEGEDGTLDEILLKYQVHFEKKILKPRFRAAVESLRGKRLGCFCRPKEGFRGKVICHAQFIWSYLEARPPDECP